MFVAPVKNKSVMLANASIQEASFPSRVPLFLQIAPVPIKMLDQREVPFARPSLQLLLARYGFLYVVISLAPNLLTPYFVVKTHGRSLDQRRG
jgi:hypothetical protein